MTVEAHCKFCKVKLRLQCDDEYAKMKDPYALIPMVACDRCADFMDGKRRIFEGFKYICERLAQRVMDEEGKEVARESLRRLALRYLHLLADYRRQPVPVFDDGIVETIMKQPDRFGNVLKRFPMMFAQQELKV